MFQFLRLSLCIHISEDPLTVATLWGAFDLLATVAQPSQEADTGIAVLTPVRPEAALVGVLALDNRVALGITLSDLLVEEVGYVDTLDLLLLLI